MQVVYACAVALVACAAASPLTPLTVKTSNGAVTGHRVGKVNEYLGIPYAQPPLGDLRFAAPQKYVGNKPYVAANYGNDCPQTPSAPVDYPGFTPQAPRIISYFAASAGTPQGEDCLTLNVWTNPSKCDKPVVVFFYGGRKYLSFPWWRFLTARLHHWKHTQPLLHG